MIIILSLETKLPGWETHPPGQSISDELELARTQLGCVPVSAPRVRAEGDVALGEQVDGQDRDALRIAVEHDHDLDVSTVVVVDEVHGERAAPDSVAMVIAVDDVDVH